MIDTAKRKKLAFHLRHLAVGLITNDEFEDRLMEDVTNGRFPTEYYKETKGIIYDPAIRPLVEECWCMYDNLDEYKFTGCHKLSDPQLREIARWILFLQSDEEFEWPYFDIINPLLRLSWRDFFLCVCSLGFYFLKIVRNKKQQYLDMQKSGDYAYWPFLCREHYEQALMAPPFLNGLRKAVA